jgi:hypothetical protein
VTALTALSSQVSEIKSGFMLFKQQVEQHVTWRRVGPSLHIISTLESKLKDISKEQ